jgi:hypothetical protein
MTYLTIEDLQQMGVEMTGQPGGSAPLKALGEDSVLLAPATVRADIKLDSGAIIPSGTAVVTMSDFRPDATASICFWQEHSPDEVTPTCNISYHLPDEEVISTAQVRETSLMLIKQGWNSTISSESASPTPPPGRAPQAPQAERGGKRPFRVVNADDGYLNIRKGPGTQYEVIAKMPLGAAGLVGRCVPLGGAWKPFCEVEWQEASGWASSCCMTDLEQSVPQGQVVAATVSAEPIVLECDLPGIGTSGVYIGFGPAWHGLLLIDKSWYIDDYSFGKDINGGTSKLLISRSSGAITESKGAYTRTGSCKKASPENRRF